MRVARKLLPLVVALSILGLAPSPSSAASVDTVTIHCSPASLDPNPRMIAVNNAVEFIVDSGCGSWLIDIPGSGSGTASPGSPWTTPTFPNIQDYPYTATQGTTVLNGLIKVCSQPDCSPVMDRTGVIALVALLGLAGLWFLRRR
ncbi:MAG: hypothetical protein U1E76_03300 [Planctomycetota bacterium]